MSAPTVPHDYVGDQPAPKPVPRTAPSYAIRAIRAVASLRLTVFLFSLAMILVFFGTLGMTQDSIEDTVKKYFRTWIAWIDMRGLAEFGKIFFGLPKDFDLPFKVPFVGGYVIGWVMFFNLLAAHAIRFKLTWKRSGIFLLHAGVIVLLAGEFLTGQLAVETRMRITEGQSTRMVFHLTDYELAFVDTSEPSADHVVVIPGEMVEEAEKDEWLSHGDLPVDVQVMEYFRNTGLRDLKDEEPAPATHGVGRRTALEKKRTVKGTDSEGEINYPGAYVALRSKDGQPLGTYLVSTLMDFGPPQEVKVGDKTYQLSYRFKRGYKPFEVHLIKATHDYYPGTNIAKDYASDVLVKDPEFGDHGPIHIWMNHPLTYRGETYYQSGMDPGTDGVKISTLQVVKNPAWTAPYLACVMVALGMGVHFLIRLVLFLKREGGK
jgi:hypothetical protein